MAHEVETMMYAKEVPWHGLGTYCGDEPVLAEDALRLSGLDWDVVKVPAIGLYDDGDDIHECNTDEFFLTVRTSDMKVLGQVQSRYTILQNTEAFSFMDSLAGPKNLVRYHTAGSLRGGKRIWLLAELTGLSIEPVPGDITTPYLLLVNGHDGRMPLKAMFTSVRVVCQNTLTMALKKSSKGGISIRHTSNMRDSIDEARKVLGLAKQEVEEYSLVARKLAKTKMNDSQWDAFLETLLPTPKEKEISKRTANIMSDLTSLWHAGPGTEIQGVRGSAWNALQAVTNYNTHSRTVRNAKGEVQERRLESTWMGAGDSMNQRALSLLVSS